MYKLQINNLNSKQKYIADFFAHVINCHQLTFLLYLTFSRNIFCSILKLKLNWNKMSNLFQMLSILEPAHCKCIRQKKTSTYLFETALQKNVEFYFHFFRFCSNDIWKHQPRKGFERIVAKVHWWNDERKRIK